MRGGGYMAVKSTSAPGGGALSESYHGSGQAAVVTLERTTGGEAGSRVKSLIVSTLLTLSNVSHTMARLLGRAMFRAMPWLRGA